MSAEDDLPADDRFVELLVAWDEALHGPTPSSGGLPELPPEWRPRLEGDLACLRLLRKAVRRSGPGELPAKWDRFQIRRELGRGTHGIVFLAYDERLSREVALKVPRPGALADPGLRQRFLREARAAAGLDHPNLVPVFDAGEVTEGCFIASAYCPGPTLAEWLKGRSEPVPVRLAATLVATLAEAVQHAHARSVLHRDLKPANVLLAGALPGDWVPRITDFGLAKLAEAEDVGQTASGTILGTAAYMAPEQAAGKAHTAGPACDLYALGAILYELLTGRPPFQGETVLDTLEQVRTCEPLSPRRLRPGLPRDLETVCLKCLHKETGKRYASAGELAEDLGRFLRGEPVRARPAGLPELLAKWVRRRPAVAGLLAVVVALLVSGTAVSAYFAAAAGRRAAEAEASERAARAAVADLEASLADGLLRPLGHSHSPPDPVEIDALWDLAGLPDQRERVRLLFLERGLARPGTAGQLDRRAELAAHAAVGLNRERRRRVLDLVCTKLRDPGTDLRIRSACVGLGLVLSAPGPAFDADATRTLLEVLEHSTTPADSTVALTRLKAIAARVSGGAELSAFVRTLCRVIERADQPGLRSSLLNVLHGLAERMSEDDAGAIVSVLEARIDRDGGNPIYVNTSTSALPPFAGRLGKDRAAAVARRLLERMARTDDLFLCNILAYAFDAVAPRLAVADPAARRLAPVVAHKGLALLTRKPPPNGPTLAVLAHTLRAVAPWLGGADVAEAFRRLTDMAALPASPETSRELPRTFRALAARVDDASVAAAARRLLGLLEQAPRANTVETLTPCFQEMVGRLSAADAREAVRRLVVALGRPAGLTAVGFLTATLKSVGARLGPGDARAVTSEMLDALARSKDEPHGFALAGAFASVADRLTAADARSAARRLLDLMEESLNPPILRPRTQALKAVIDHLGPADTRPAARRILKLMAETADPTTLGELGGAFARVAGALPESEAREAASAFLDRMARDGNPFVPFALAESFQGTARRLGGADADALARRLLGMLDRERRGAGAVQALAGGLKALGPRLGKANAAAVATGLVRAMGRCEGNDLIVLVEALGAVVDRLGEAECAAAARGVLAAVGGRTGSFYDLSALLKALPLLPERPGPGTAGVRRAAAAAVLRVLEAVGRHAGNPSALPPLSAALRVVAGRLGEPGDEVRRAAAKASRQLLESLDQHSRPIQFQGIRVGAFPPLGEALRAVTSLADGGERRRSLTKAQSVMAEAMARVHSPPVAVAEAWGSLLDDLSVQELVGLLKTPVCVGATRGVVLARLGRRLGHPFASLEDLADWLARNGPGVDLDTPPQRLPVPP